MNNKLYWLVTLGVLPTVLVSLIELLPEIFLQGTNTVFDMQNLFFYRQGMAVTILGPGLFALMTGFIVAREYY